MAKRLEEDGNSPLDPLWSELAAIGGGEPGVGQAEDFRAGRPEGEGSALAIRVRDSRFPGHRIQNPDRRCDELMNLRFTRPVREEDITRILGVDKGHIILQFFGSRTWFWEVRVKKGARSCTLVVARLPDPRANAAELNARLFVIGTSFEP